MEEVVESADALFKKVGNAIKLILGDDSSLYDNEQAYETISTIEKCKERVDNEHLFSVNEQIDDINTVTLKVCIVVAVFKFSFIISLFI